MCGIVGLVTKYQNGLSYAEVNAIESLLYVDALRGEDSTGTAVFYNDGSTEVLKDCLPASVFLTKKDFSTLAKDLSIKGKCVIGHNRKKTVGGSDSKSAHPFVINNNILFVHNGTLTGFPTLKENLHSYLKEIGVDTPELSPKTEVDSEYLGTLLGMTAGDKNKVETVLGNIHGAYACVWIDQEKEKLFLLRNHERPLWLATTDSGIAWASESSFLSATLPRSGIAIKKVEEVPINTLLSVDLSKPDPVVVKEPLLIKKYFTQYTSTTNSTGAWADKEYKNFCKQWLNKETSFYIDDFIERDLASKKKSGFFVWGTNDSLFPSGHLCRAVLPDISENDMYMKWCGAHVSGVVEKITKDITTNTPSLFFKDIKIFGELVN